MKWWRVILAIIVLIILIWADYVRPVTERWSDWTGFVAKVIWDFMGLLIVPIALAIGAYWLNESARKREREIADQNRQEDILQTYLDRIEELLIEEKLRESEKESEVRAVARMRTLTVLLKLDEDRKGKLLRFLYGGKFINKKYEVIDLRGADLNLANLSEAILSGAWLSGADLSEADLIKADLSEADLIKADLSGADLRGANLRKAKLSYADLIGTDLREVNLSYADLREADLSEAWLRRAKLIKADLRGANLINADLNLADLSNANLSMADLREADLNKAYLNGASLSGAQYTKNAKDFNDTIWPEDFDPDAEGAICVNE